MKNKILPLVAFALLAFSCSNDSSTNETEPKLLLRSYTLKKDSYGYSVDYHLNSDVKVDVVDGANGTNFYLSPKQTKSADQRQTRKYSSDLKEVKMVFVDKFANKNETVLLQDTNVSLTNKKEETSQLLLDYAMQKAGDNTYVFNFTVKPNIEASFVYNEKLGVNEVHLKKGTNSAPISYSKSYIRAQGEALKVDFVDYTKDNAKITSRGLNNKLLGLVNGEYRPRRPRWIIDDTI